MQNFTRLLLVLLAVLPLGVAAPAAAQDPTDPAPIDLGDITALPQPAFRPARLAGAAAAVHTYQFTLTAAQAVGLGVRQQDADADLYLTEATGPERGRSAAAGTAPEWIQATLLAGTYTVRVEAREAGENQYVLRYGVSAPDADEVARLEAEQDSDDDADDDNGEDGDGRRGRRTRTDEDDAGRGTEDDPERRGYRGLRRVRTTDEDSADDDDGDDNDDSADDNGDDDSADDDAADDADAHAADGPPPPGAADGPAQRGQPHQRGAPLGRPRRRHHHRLPDTPAGAHGRDRASDDCRGHRLGGPDLHR